MEQTEYQQISKPSKRRIVLYGIIGLLLGLVTSLVFIALSVSLFGNFLEKASDTIEILGPVIALTFLVISVLITVFIFKKSLSFARGISELPSSAGPAYHLQEIRRSFKILGIFGIIFFPFLIILMFVHLEGKIFIDRSFLSFAVIATISAIIFYWIGKSFDYLNELKFKKVRFILRGILIVIVLGLTLKIRSVFSEEFYAGTLFAVLGYLFILYHTLKLLLSMRKMTVEEFLEHLSKSQFGKGI